MSTYNSWAMASVFSSQRGRLQAAPKRASKIHAQVLDLADIMRMHVCFALSFVSC